MTIQEHEEQNFIHESEASMCYQEAGIARIHRNDEEQQKIQAALALGRFVVVEDCPFYCKATDGLVGNVRYFRAAYESREEADETARQIYENDPEAQPSVLPLLPPPPQPVVEATPEDDIPF